MELPLSNDRRMKVDEFDSGKMLANAARQAKQRNYDSFRSSMSTRTTTSWSRSTRSWNTCPTR